MNIAYALIISVIILNVSGCAVNNNTVRVFSFDNDLSINGNKIEEERSKNGFDSISSR